MSSNILKDLGKGILGLAIALIALKLLWSYCADSQFFFLSFGVLALLCLTLALFQKIDAIKNISLMGFGLSIILMFIEGGFWAVEGFSSKHKEKNTTFACGTSTTMHEADRELGYRGIKGPIQCNAYKKKHDKDVYKVSYNFNEHGFRITPHTNKNGDSILFLGGSFTFGEGVNDDETLPYYVSEIFNHQYNVENLGLDGYGPHQILRMIETGMLRNIIKGNVRAAIFTTALWHTPRILGQASWDQTGPRYEKLQNDDFVFTGPFKSEKWVNLEKFLKNSRFFKWCIERPVKLSGADIELYLDMVAKISNLFEKEFGAPLIILFWDSSHHTAKRFGGYSSQTASQRLKEQGLTVIQASEVIDFDDPIFRIKGDGHPSPYAYRLEAKLVSKILQQILKPTN